MPLSREGKERSFHENVVLAFSLAAVAGAVNAIGLAELGFLTSHVTGTSTRLGAAIATLAWLEAWKLAAFVGTFVAGAMLAALLIEVARRKHWPRFQIPLLIEAIVLVTLTIFTEIVARPTDDTKLMLALTLSAAMGLQNALVTRLSGAVIRTTHLTGLATDMGIEIVRVAAWFLERTRGEGLLERIRHIAYVRKDPELYRARLHATIFVSFVGGAAAGMALFSAVRAMAMVAPVVALVALIFYDRALNVSDEDLDGEFNPAFADDARGKTPASKPPS